MVLAIAFAHVWGVIQLIVLGSLARTVRVRTVLAALAVGLYAIGPLTVLLQLGWIHVAASLFGTPVAHLTQVASYTVDPFLEEALKLLPLGLLLLLVPAIRRQWSLTDCVLIAAAVGSGYGLAENLYRYAASPAAAHAVSGGWALEIGSVTVLVPGLLRTLTSWLPTGTSFVGDTILVNSHLVWSALGGLALGLLVRYRSMAARVAAGGLLLYIGLDHAAWNAALYPDSWLSFLAKPLGALASWGGLLVLAALVVAWWLDRSAQPAGQALEPLLAAERSATSPIAGMLKATVSRLPWSIPRVFGFARARRAYHAARATATEDLLGPIVAHRDRVDRELTQPESPPLLPESLAPNAVKSAVRRPAVIIALVCLVPSILFLIVGGFPQTAGIQAAMRGPVLWPIVLLITVLAQARLVWGVIVGIRNWSTTRRLPMGDDAAILGLQLACAVGAVGLAGFTLTRVFGGVSAGSRLLGNAHGADAANRLTPDLAFPVTNSAGAAAPAAPGKTQPGEAAPPKTKAPSTPDAESAPPPPPKPKPPAAAPKPTPDEIAAKAEARAIQDAARAEALAVEAESEALEAQNFRKQAINALDAADIANATGLDDDPTVAAARERTRQANDASEKADIAALDDNDPFGTGKGRKAAADAAHREARAAKTAQTEAENAFRERKAADVTEARTAARIAKDAMNAAEAKAAAAREQATKAAHAVAEARGAHSGRVARVDDP